MGYWTDFIIPLPAIDEAAAHALSAALLQVRTGGLDVVKIPGAALTLVGSLKGHGADDVVFAIREMSEVFSDKDAVQVMYRGEDCARFDVINVWPDGASSPALDLWPEILRLRDDLRQAREDIKTVARAIMIVEGLPKS